MQGAELFSLLENLRLNPMLCEKSIHKAIMNYFDANNISYKHEAYLFQGARIDFLVGSIGIEIKKSKPNKQQVLQQLERYMQSDMLSSLIFISEKSITLPKTINNKNVLNLSLNKLWGIAL